MKLNANQRISASASGMMKWAVLPARARQTRCEAAQEASRRTILTIIQAVGAGLLLSRPSAARAESELVSPHISAEQDMTIEDLKAELEKLEREYQEQQRKEDAEKEQLLQFERSLEKLKPPAVTVSAPASTSDSSTLTSVVIAGGTGFILATASANERMKDLQTVLAASGTLSPSKAPAQPEPWSWDTKPAPAPEENASTLSASSYSALAPPSRPITSPIAYKATGASNSIPAASYSAPPAAFSAQPAVNKDLANKIASLERQIKDANSEARKAPLIAQLNALKFGSVSSFSSPDVYKAPVWNNSAPAIVDKDLAAKILSLERQIRDANSDARKAPLIAKLNALRSGSASSYSVPVPKSSSTLAAAYKVPSASFSDPVILDKDLAAKIQSLEKQIKDANSEARKAPLIAKLNALRSGSANSSMAYAAPTHSSPFTMDSQLASAADAARATQVWSSSTSIPTPLTGNKDLDAKIASLEKQIKDANSQARKAPLIAQLNALRSSSSPSYYSAPSYSAPTGGRTSVVTNASAPPSKTEKPYYYLLRVPKGMPVT